MTWKNWNEGIEMSELTWRNWNERIEMNELTEGTKEGMNEGMGDWRNEGRKEGRKWMNWNEWLETNELIWKNFNERIETNELKRMNWSEWIETKELNRMNWNEWIEANELKGMDCHKCSEPLQFFFAIFIWNRALATSCRPHLQSVLSDLQFLFTVCMRNRALATVSCTFCRPHFHSFSKSGPKVSFFHDFMWSTTWWRCGWHMKPNSRYSLVHILSTTFPDWGSQPRKQRPSSGDRGQPLYLKKTQGFAPESVFKREFTRSRSLTLPNYRCWCGWHDDWDDDVGAMMLRQLATDNRL